MATQIKTHLEDTIGFDGKREQKQWSEITVVCDGPRCHKPDSACPGQMTWTETPETKGEEVPDDAFRLIVLQNFHAEQKAVFFSRECLRDAMREYNPPRSPREIAATALANAEAEKKRQEKLGNMVEIPTPEQEKGNVIEMPTPAPEVIKTLSDAEIDEALGGTETTNENPTV